MRRLVILGAGGHAREVADIARHAQQAGADFELLGFIDDDPRLHGKVLQDTPVLGGWGWLDGIERSDLAVVVAVGSPHICRRLALRARENELCFARVISPLAHISPYARLGEGAVVFPNTVVNAGAKLGEHCILNVGASISHDTSVGRYSNINPGAHVAGNVTIGEGCYIGMGTNVIQGRSIGGWTTVGAGAVVIRDLPANVTAVGVPAQVINTKEEGWHER